MLDVFRREAARCWAENRVLLVLCILAPLFYGVYCTVLYGQRKITKIPITVVDLDHSHLSREITTALLSSESFRLGQYESSPEIFPKLAALGLSNACVTFPPNFERDALRGQPVKVAFWADASNIAIANVALTAGADIVGRYSVGMDSKRTLMNGSSGSSTRAISSAVYPMRDEYRVLYSPALNANYANFLMLGFIGVAIQLLTVLLGSGSISREIENKTLRSLKETSGGAWAVVAGKTAFIVTVMFAPSLLAYAICVPLCQVPFRGDPLMLALSTFWFIFIVALFAIGMSALFRVTMMATQLLAIIVMPSFLLSGFTWPMLGMAPFAHVIALAMPLTHYLILVRRITMLGDGIVQMREPIQALAIWTLFALFFAWITVWRVLKTEGAQP